LPPARNAFLAVGGATTGRSEPVHFGVREEQRRVRMRNYRARSDVDVTALFDETVHKRVTPSTESRIERVRLEIPRIADIVLHNRRVVKYTRMDTIFSDNAGNFNFTTHRISGDNSPEVCTLQRPLRKKRSAGATVPQDETSTLPSPVCTRGHLPFSGAVRSLCNPLSHETQMPHSGASAAEDHEEMEAQEPRDLCSFCLALGVKKITEGQVFIIRRENCHDLLADPDLLELSWGEQELQAASESVSASREQEKGDLDGSESGESDNSLDTTEEGDDDEPVDADLWEEEQAEPDETEREMEIPNEDVEGERWVRFAEFAQHVFRPGYAQMRSIRGRKRPRTEENTGLIEPEMKVHLKSFYESGKKRGQRVDDAAALDKLQQQSYLPFELPTLAQVHAYLAQLHSAGKQASSQ